MAYIAMFESVMFIYYYLQIFYNFMFCIYRILLKVVMPDNHDNFNLSNLSMKSENV